MKKILSQFTIALLGGIVSLGIYKMLEKDPSSIAKLEENAKTTLVNLVGTAPDVGTNYVTAAEMSVNGVVHVKTEGTMEYRQQEFDPFREFFFGDGRYERKFQQPIRGAGSGVILSEDGYIVTNNHVIDNADEINITLNNKKSYKAALIGTDPTTDLALLKIDEEDLPYIEIGNSDQLRIGEWVLAVGNPFNLTSTVTAGIVSAKGRDINILGNDPFTGLSSIESFIQTDAAVNPGNSGGALVNTQGELIGINSAIKSNTGSYAGYSFAIPANIVKKVVADLKEYGTVQRAFIGIQIRNIDQELADDLKLDDLNGVYVSGLMENGSAEEAGIEEGDIVIKVEDIVVNTVTELQGKIGSYRPGDEVSVEILRDGKILEKNIVLKNMEGNTAIIKDDQNQLRKLLGAKFAPLNDEQKETYKVEQGVVVEELFPGKLKNAGIRESFVITHVDNQVIKDESSLMETLEAKSGGVLIQGVYPNGKEYFYGLGM
ncbi:MAG: deoxyribonuclease HsdR [Verrucomicrobia bacterium]|nr:deoxyribonuclease HsdR [Verrucomicrobiota bacterium]|tara:strand:+ start:834 stop:2297 length:1464 start_codon:yes stop_codon:yes gene_type:complete